MRGNVCDKDKNKLALYPRISLFTATKIVIILHLLNLMMILGIQAHWKIYIKLQ